MGLENIQERKGKRHSLPDTFFFLVFILARYFVCAWQKQSSPQSTLTSALFSARTAKPQARLWTGTLRAAQLASMSALNPAGPCFGTNSSSPSEPGQRSTLTGRVTLQLAKVGWLQWEFIRQSAVSLGRADAEQLAHSEQTPNSCSQKNYFFLNFCIRGQGGGGSVGS